MTKRIPERDEPEKLLAALRPKGSRYIDGWLTKTADKLPEDYAERLARGERVPLPEAAPPPTQENGQ
jgi:hypothetical protein